MAVLLTHWHTLLLIHTTEQLLQLQPPLCTSQKL